MGSRGSGMAKEKKLAKMPSHSLHNGTPFSGTAQKMESESAHIMRTLAYADRMLGNRPTKRAQQSTPRKLAS